MKFGSVGCDSFSETCSSLTGSPVRASTLPGCLTRSGVERRGIEAEVRPHFVEEGRQCAEIEARAPLSWRALIAKAPKPLLQVLYGAVDYFLRGDVCRAVLVGGHPRIDNLISWPKGSDKFHDVWIVQAEVGDDAAVPRADGAPRCKRIEG